LTLEKVVTQNKSHALVPSYQNKELQQETFALVCFKACKNNGQFLRFYSKNNVQLRYFKEVPQDGKEFIVIFVSTISSFIFEMFGFHFHPKCRWQPFFKLQNSSSCI